MKCHILKLELVDKWHNWLCHMVCDVINDVTEVGQKFENWRIYFIFSSFYSRMLFKGAEHNVVNIVR